MNKELDATIDAYTNAWNKLDLTALAALWSQTEPTIYYVAEEIDHPFFTLDEVNAYWAHTAKLVSSVEISTSDRRCKFLADDIAVVTFSMHMNASLKSEIAQKPIGVDVRISCILRNTKDGWRFIHYAESPLGALPFVRRAYQTNAT